MEVGALINILRGRGGADEVAAAVVELARDSTGKSVETAFGVALGTGALGRARAEQLCEALTRMADAQGSSDDPNILGHPSVAELRREVAELSGQHERLRREQANVAARREAVSNLEAEVSAARDKAAALEAELEALRERARRLDALRGEVLR